jgi:hypothetical protein
VLRAGTYYTDTVDITSDLSGLTIQNYNGESAVVSGGVSFTIPASAWKPCPQLSPHTYVASVPNVDDIAGLRLDGQRMIRAKFPNGNMELSGNWLQGADSNMGRGGKWSDISRLRN